MTEVAAVALDPRSPRARLANLFDDGQFVTITPDDDRGVLAAVGRANGANVVAFITDPTVQGGAMGSAGCRAIVTAYDRAFADSAPIIGIWHSGGARLREGVASLDGVGRVFAAMTRASGKVPQISVVLGPAAGGAAYGPALTDIVILAPAGRIFVTGPEVVRSVTGEDVDMESLGGPEPHGRRSGVVHIVADSEQDALDHARTLAALLGHQGSLNLDAVDDVDLGALLPESARRAYDVHPLIEGFSMPAASRSCIPGGPQISPLASGALADAPSGSSRITQCVLAAAWTLLVPRRPHDSCACAMPSPCHLSCSLTYPATCRALVKNGKVWFAAARNYFTHSLSASCPGLPWSRARLMAAPSLP